MTGSIIVGKYADSSIRKEREREAGKIMLSYSFVDNSILLSTETIQKNGFREVWRQENKEHSVQILCFNDETGEFKAFDRLHWMDEPHDIPNAGVYNVYKKDLWTPIELHYTVEWLKSHMI